MDDKNDFPDLEKVFGDSKNQLPGIKAITVGSRIFQIDAVVFLMFALRKAAVLYGKDATDLSEVERHLSGRELLEGIRALALDMFGPLAPLVFRHWGVHTTDDWGEIVFLLVEQGVLKRTEEDSRTDFAGVYDFSVAFRPPDYWKKARMRPISLPRWKTS